MHKPNNLPAVLFSLVVLTGVLTGCGKSDDSGKNSDHSLTQSEKARIDTLKRMENAKSKREKEELEKRQKEKEERERREKEATYNPADLPKPDLTKPLSEYIALDDTQFRLIWLANQKTPVDFNDLAEQLDDQYRNENDTFKRHDLFERLKPNLEKKLEQLKSIRYGKIKVHENIYQYNFSKKGFPFASSDIRDVKYGVIGATLGWSNPETYLLYPVADEQKARDAHEKLKEYGSINADVYFFIQRAGPENVRDCSERDRSPLFAKNQHAGWGCFTKQENIVRAYVTKVKLIGSKAGSVLGEWGPGPSQ